MAAGSPRGFPRPHAGAADRIGDRDLGTIPRVHVKYLRDNQTGLPTSY